MVKLLLAEGLSCEKVDLHGDTVTNIADKKDYEKVLEILPHDLAYDIAYSNFHERFEDIFINLRPQFKCECVQYKN